MRGIAQSGWLHAFFLSLIQGCTSHDYGPACGTYEENESVPASVVADLPVVDGHYPKAQCSEICTFSARVLSCGPGSDPTTGEESGGESSGGGDEVLAFVECSYEDDWSCSVGRASRGLASDGRVDATNPRARWLARMAHSEAASVATFLRLHDELEAHDAPADLLIACRHAARDEARHARVMRRWCRRFGVEPMRPSHRAARVASLEEQARASAFAELLVALSRRRWPAPGLGLPSAAQAIRLANSMRDHLMASAA